MIDTSLYKVIFEFFDNILKLELNDCHDKSEKLYNKIVNIDRNQEDICVDCGKILKDQRVRFWDETRVKGNQAINLCKSCNLQRLKC